VLLARDGITPMKWASLISRLTRPLVRAQSAQWGLVTRDLTRTPPNRSHRWPSPGDRVGYIQDQSNKK